MQIVHIPSLFSVIFKIMIRRITALFITLFCLTFAAVSQVSRGTIMAGGNVGFQFNTNKEFYKSTLNFTFAPTIGGFVGKNAVLGVQPFLQYVSSSGSIDTPIVPSKILIEERSTSLGIGPYFRYYIPLSPKAYVFFHASTSIMVVWAINKAYDPNHVTQKYVAANWAIGPGFGYKLSQSVALEASIYYNGMWHQTSQSINGALLSESKGFVDHGMVLNVGVQVYIERKPKKTTDVKK